MKFNNKLGRKACVAGLAFATAMAMVPTAAFAKVSLNDNTSDFIINRVSPGDTVTAYQILNRHYDAASNNVTDTWFDTDESTLSMDDFLGATTDGYTYNPNTQMQQYADKIAASITSGTETALQQPYSKKATGTSVTFESVPAGEYLVLVTGTNGVKKVYQNTIVNAGPAAENGKYVTNAPTVDIKSSDETVSKGVGTTAEDATSKKTADGLYGIGDLVPFVISTTIPQYPADSSKATFVIGDTPSAGLELQSDGVTVTVGGKQVAAGDSTYTLSVQGGSMTITFAKDYILKNPGQSVLVNYKAKVTSDAKVTSKDTTNNTATITFNPNPYTDGTSQPSDTDQVKTYGLFFVKKGDGQPLAGATFKIKKQGASDYLKDENGKDLESTSDKNGYVWFEDLAKGTYTLVETSAPTGYQKVADFDVTIDGKGTADNPATTDVTEANYVQYSKDTGVTDPKVGLLPTTGDAGTIGLTAAGICLVAGSAFVIAGHNKRAKKNED